VKILLHVCCAPCALYSFEHLEKRGHTAEGLFFNPNIHPYTEYKARLKSIEDLALSEGLKMSYGDYGLDDFLACIGDNTKNPGRCSACWRMRLEETARCAGEDGFEAFTTTLLISPYQDQEELKKIGSEIEGKTGVKFYYADFRKGFRQSQHASREKGFYMQKYCGCIFSEKERYEK